MRENSQFSSVSVFEGQGQRPPLSRPPFLQIGGSIGGRFANHYFTTAFSTCECATIVKFAWGVGGVTRPFRPFLVPIGAGRLCNFGFSAGGTVRRRARPSGGPPSAAGERRRLRRAQAAIPGRASPLTRGVAHRYGYAFRNAICNFLESLRGGRATAARSG